MLLYTDIFQLMGQRSILFGSSTSEKSDHMDGGRSLAGMSAASCRPVGLAVAVRELSGADKTCASTRRRDSDISETAKAGTREKTCARHRHSGRLFAPVWHLYYSEICWNNAVVLESIRLVRPIGGWSS